MRTKKQNMLQRLKKKIKQVNPQRTDKQKLYDSLEERKYSFPEMIVWLQWYYTFFMENFKVLEFKAPVPKDVHDAVGRFFEWMEKRQFDIKED